MCVSLSVCPRLIFIVADDFRLIRGLLDWSLSVRGRPLRLISVFSWVLRGWLSRPISSFRLQTETCTALPTVSCPTKWERVNASVYVDFLCQFWAITSVIAWLPSVEWSHQPAHSHLWLSCILEYLLKTIAARRHYMKSSTIWATWETLCFQLAMTLRFLAGMTLLIVSSRMFVKLMPYMKRQIEPECRRWTQAVDRQLTQHEVCAVGCARAVSSV